MSILAKVSPKAVLLLLPIPGASSLQSPLLLSLYGLFFKGNTVLSRKLCIAGWALEEAGHPINVTLGTCMLSGLPMAGVKILPSPPKICSFLSSQKHPDMMSDFQVASLLLVRRYVLSASAGLETESFGERHSCPSNTACSCSH